MNGIRRKKLIQWLFILSVIAVTLALVMYALKQNISLFYTPTQIAQGEAPQKRQIRMGGMVVKNSVIRTDGSLAVVFTLTDFQENIVVSYDKILPDLFREGQGIVALGEVLDNGHFKATEVLAKHDANYMPPEVKNALAKGRKNG